MSFFCESLQRLSPSINIGFITNMHASGDKRTYKPSVLPAGMAANELVLRRNERSGIGVLQPLVGLDALQAAVSGLRQPLAPPEIVIAAPFNWTVFLKVLKHALSMVSLASCTFLALTHRV